MRNGNEERFSLCEEKELLGTGSDSDGKELIVVASHSGERGGGSQHMSGEVMFQQVYVKLQNLEEDNTSLMKELVESVEERSKLMREVCEMLQIIHQHQRTSAVSLVRDGSTTNGLLQVLRAHSSPSLVTRVFKANTLSFLNPDSLMSNVRISK